MIAQAATGQQPALIAQDSKVPDSKPHQSSWQDLRDQFLSECNEQDADPSNRWNRIWHVLVNHAWYRQQLTSAATATLRNSQYPFHWRQDIEQEATVLLSRRLRSNPTLGVDPDRATHHFGGWMRTIINHDCCNAVRKLCRNTLFTYTLPQSLPVPDARVQSDACLDLAFALSQLDAQERVVVILRSQGFTVNQVAAKINRTFWNVHRDYHSGLKRLRHLLSV